MFFRTIIFAMLSLFISSGAIASQIMPKLGQNIRIDNLVEEAQDAVCGTIADLKVEDGDNGQVYNYTLLVDKVMKGEHKEGDKIIIKQKQLYKGAVSYQVNKDYCLLLNKPSPSGFRSPVGFRMGVYRVNMLPDGSRRLETPINRDSLFSQDVLTRRPTLSKSVSEVERSVFTAKDKRYVNYEDFVSLVKKINEEDVKRINSEKKEGR